jgi:hypothetical protein
MPDKTLPAATLHDTEAMLRLMKAQFEELHEAAMLLAAQVGVQVKYLDRALEGLENERNGYG